MKALPCREDEARKRCICLWSRPAQAPGGGSPLQFLEMHHGALRVDVIHGFVSSDMRYNRPGPSAKRHGQRQDTAKSAIAALCGRSRNPLVWTDDGPA